ncbi:MAG: ATP-binding protein [bacterium]
MINFQGIFVADSSQFIQRIITPLDFQKIQMTIDIAESEDICLSKLESHLCDIVIIYHHPPAIDILRLVRAVVSKNFPAEMLVIAPPGNEKVLNQAIMEGAFSYYVDDLESPAVVLQLVSRMIQFLSSQERRARQARRGETRAAEAPLPAEKEQPPLVYEEKLKILDRLTSFIAHELKNPFTTINNALYFLQKKIPDQADPVFPKYIHIVENEIASSNRFLSTLLSVTRKIQTNPVPSQVNEILTETVHHIPISQKIKVNFQLDPLIPVSMIDPEQMQIAFSQVIRNSIQAMPEGGELTIQTAYAKKTLEVRIIDQGTGIDPKYLPHITEAFFTTKTRNIGLGLTIAQRIIEAHNGHILFDSMPGQGTRCTMVLPHS